jgi:hypothetical protein
MYKDNMKSFKIQIQVTTEILIKMHKHSHSGHNNLIQTKNLILKGLNMTTNTNKFYTHNI